MSPSVTPLGEAKTRVFLSYSRTDVAFASWLRAELEQHGVEVFRDIDDTLPGEEWWARLKELIGKADTIVFVLSPNSVASKVCADEVAHARSLSKRIFPVVIADVNWEAVPEGLAKIHSTVFTEEASREAAVESLTSALLTDIAWVREHTRLGEIAQRWKDKQPRDLLLRGVELDAAETWITRQPGSGSPPTNVQRAFIKASRDAARRRQRWTTVTSLSVALLTGVLGMLAWVQRQEAVRNEAEARAARDRALVAQSRFLADVSRQKTHDGDAGTAMLLAIEALPDVAADRRRPHVADAEAALYAAVHSLREALVLPQSMLVGGLSRAADKASLKDVSTLDPTVNILLEDLMLAPHMVNLMGGLRIGFDASKNLILTHSKDGARLWDAENGKQLWKLPPELGEEAAGLSHDGRRVAVSSPGNRAEVWDVGSKTRSTELQGHTQLLTTIQFSPDGGQLLTGSWDRTARLWDARSGHLLHVLQHKEGVTHAIFVLDGAKIVTASNKGTFLWETSTGQKLAEYAGEVRHLAVGERGGFVATCTGESLAELWDAPTGRLIAKIGSDRVASAAFSHDEKRIVTGSLSGSIKVFASEDGREILRLAGHGRGVASVSFSKDDRQILSASFDGTARLWDATTGAEIAVLAGHSKGLIEAQFGRDAAIVTAALDGTARVWVFKRLPALDQQPDDTRGNTAGTRRLVVEENVVKIVDAATGVEKATLKGHKGTVLAATFSADGDLVVTASYDGTARIWNSSSGAEVGLLRGHAGPVLSAAFSRDAGRVATGSADRTAIVWDVATGQPVGRIGPLGHDVQRVWFSADSSRLLTALRDGSVAAWRHFPNTQQLLTYAKSVVPRCLGQQQRERFFLQPEPPRWCITGAEREHDEDATKWLAKWPYLATSWRDWLVARSLRPNAPLPRTPD